MSIEDQSTLVLIQACKGYTGNRLTLCQAANVIAAYHGSYGQHPTPKFILRALGHRLTEADEVEIDAFDGIDAWWSAGHRPQGWHQLFRDNYKQYKEKLCIPQTMNQMDENAGVVSRPHSALYAEPKEVKP